MIGTFPLLEVPSGARDRGLGNGSAQVLLPIWIQKSFGTWTTYGGTGVWIDAGDRDRHWWYFGWQAQRQLSKGFALGAEIFHTTPQQHGGDGDTRFNIGAVIDFTEM